MLNQKVLKELFSKDNIIINAKSTTRDDLFNEIATLAKKNKFITSEKGLVDLFIKRETQSSTAFEDGFAIPHAREEKGNTILKPAIFIIKSKSGIEDWIGFDEKPVEIAFAIIMPKPEKKDSSSFYIDVLSTLSSSLINDDFRISLKTITDEDKLLDLVLKQITGKLESKNTEEQNTIPTPVVTSNDSDSLAGKKVVAITACTTGVAHTYMVAEVLEKFAKNNNIIFKCEKQGAKGPENQLTKQEIADADFVIFAIGKGIDKSRFAGKRCHEVKLQEALKDPKKVFTDAMHNQRFQSGTVNNSLGDDKVSIMKHLLSGISYMIPFVITAGILLSLTIGFGTNQITNTPKSEFWAALGMLSKVGFTLMFSILAGFIANSIGGQVAMAPAMILIYALNFIDPTNLEGVGPSPVNNIIWNWQQMKFGHFDTVHSFSPAPGFFGAIGVGLAMGYSIKAFNKINFPKFIRPIMPIMVIPILFTFVGWIIFAFFLAWPFIGLSIALKAALIFLNNEHLFIIVAIVVGFMIAFDMGGPINKIAVLVSTSLIPTDGGQTMAYAGVAIGIPPLACGLAYYFSKNVLKLRFDEQDKTNGLSAILLSFVGITEGAIPWAIKYPKAVFAGNIIGAIFGTLMLFTLSLITNSIVGNSAAAYGGIIVYLVGAVGHVNASHMNVTDYGIGFMYVASILIGGIVGSMVTSFLMKRIQKKEDMKTNASTMDKTLPKEKKEFNIKNIFKRNKMAITNNVKKQV